MHKKLFQHIAFFGHRHNHVFDGVYKLGMANHKVNHQRASLRHHGPLALAQADLQIAEGGCVGWMHIKVRVLFGKSRGGHDVARVKGIVEEDFFVKKSPERARFSGWASNSSL